MFVTRFIMIFAFILIYKDDHHIYIFFLQAIWLTCKKFPATKFLVDIKRFTATKGRSVVSEDKMFKFCSLNFKFSCYDHLSFNIFKVMHVYLLI